MIPHRRPKPGEYTRDDYEPPRVHDGGPWRGPSVEEWVAKIAAASTPKRELDAEGRFRGWINPDRERAS